MNKLKLYSTILLVIILGGCLRSATSSGLTTPTSKTYKVSGNFSQGESVYAIFTGTDVARKNPYEPIVVNGNKINDILINPVGPAKNININSFEKKNNEFISNLYLQKPRPTNKLISEKNILNVDISNFLNGKVKVIEGTKSIDGINVDNFKEISVVQKINDTSSKSGVNLKVWIENTYSNDFNSHIAKISSMFLNATDDNIYNYVSNLFGDLNTPNISEMITIGSTKEINIVLYKNTIDDGMVGYFNPADVWKKSNYLNMDYSPEFRWALENSNEALTIYLNLSYLDVMEKEVYSALGHEFSHMSVYFNRQLKTLFHKKSLETWINEMLALIGEDYMASKLNLSGPRGIQNVDSTLKDSVTDYFTYRDRRYPYGRLDEYNAYNYYDINDKDGNFDSPDYATVYSYGAFLIRNYDSVIKPIISSEYSDYRAIESVVGTGNFVSSLKEYGKSLILSNENQRNLSKKINFEFPVSKNGFKLGSINLYNYNENFLFFNINSTNASGISGGANIYFKLGENIKDGLKNWTFTLPVGIDYQIIVKDNDGSYNLTKTKELNDNIVIN